MTRKLNLPDPACIQAFYDDLMLLCEDHQIYIAAGGIQMEQDLSHYSDDRLTHLHVDFIVIPPVGE